MVFKGFQGCSRHFKGFQSCSRVFQASERGVPRYLRAVTGDFNGVPEASELFPGVSVAFQGANSVDQDCGGFMIVKSFLVYYRCNGALQFGIDDCPKVVIQKLFNCKYNEYF